MERTPKGTYKNTHKNEVLLAELRGMELTEKEFKQKFGYSPSTVFQDTFLWRQHLVIPVEGSKPKRWRIK